MTAPPLPSISLQPGNRMEEQLPSSERARQGEKQSFTSLFIRGSTMIHVKIKEKRVYKTADETIAHNESSPNA